MSASTQTADSKSANASAGGGAATNGAAAAPFKGPYWENPAYDFFDDDLKRFAAERKFPDLKTQLRSGLEAHELARSRNVWPKPDPEKLADWPHWVDLGWKPDRKEYTLKNPEKVPEGVVPDDSLRALIEEAFHEARVPLPASQRVYEKLFNHFAGKISERAAALARKEAELNKALEEKWGADRARNVELARRAVRYFGADEETTEALERALGAPGMLEFFHKLGTMIGEDKLEAGGAGGGALPESVAAIDAELNRMRGDEKFVAVLNDERHPQHKDFVAQRDRLIERKAALLRRGRG